MSETPSTYAFRGGVIAALGMIMMEIGGYNGNELVLQSIGVWAGIGGSALIVFGVWLYGRQRWGDDDG